MSVEDVAIHVYAGKLQTIYDEKTAGKHTFVGVLDAFLRHVDKERADAALAAKDSSEDFGYDEVFNSDEFPSLSEEAERQSSE